MKKVPNVGQVQAPTGCPVAEMRRSLKLDISNVPFALNSLTNRAGRQPHDNSRKYCSWFPAPH